jgi:hypothetical protein
MLLDKTVRENLNGKYLIIHANQLREGVEYAVQIKIPQIQIRGILGGMNNVKVDFKELEKLSEYLKFISLSTIDNIVNLESIYTLKNLEKIYLNKQKFTIDISKFPRLIHLGSEYWKGLINFGKVNSLISLVFTKFPDTNLKRISELQNLKILHIYNSKIQTLEGIEELPIEELFLARNNYLEDILSIKKLTMLNELIIEKCKKIINYEIVDSINNRVKVNIIY